LGRDGGDEPVGIEDGGSVTTEERKAIWQLSALGNRNDGESASSTGFPIDRDVLGIGL